MNVVSFKEMLQANANAPLQIMLPSGEFVPTHFHITEIGRVHKMFVDCGGTSRETMTCVLQVWVANDIHHRLDSTKLSKIFDFSKFISDDLPLEIEYQTESVSVYPVGDVEVTPSGLLIVLGVKNTECLAPDKCGVGECCKGN